MCWFAPSLLDTVASSSTIMPSLVQHLHPYLFRIFPPLLYGNISPFPCAVCCVSIDFSCAAANHRASCIRTINNVALISSAAASGCVTLARAFRTARTISTAFHFPFPSPHRILTAADVCRDGICLVCGLCFAPLSPGVSHGRFVGLRGCWRTRCWYDMAAANMTFCIHRCGLRAYTTTLCVTGRGGDNAPPPPATTPPHHPVTTAPLWTRCQAPALPSCQ